LSATSTHTGSVASSDVKNPDNHIHSDSSSNSLAGSRKRGIDAFLEELKAEQADPTISHLKFSQKATEQSLGRFSGRKSSKKGFKNVNIALRSLDPNIQKSDLLQVCSRFGEIISCKLLSPLMPTTNSTLDATRNVASAFVLFADTRSAEACFEQLRLGQVQLGSHPATVSWAPPPYLSGHDHSVADPRETEKSVSRSGSGREDDAMIEKEKEKEKEKAAWLAFCREELTPHCQLVGRASLFALDHPSLAPWIVESLALIMQREDTPFYRMLGCWYVLSDCVCNAHVQGRTTYRNLVELQLPSLVRGIHDRWLKTSARMARVRAESYISAVFSIWEQRSIFSHAFLQSLHGILTHSVTDGREALTATTSVAVGKYIDGILLDEELDGVSWKGSDVEEEDPVTMSESLAVEQDLSLAS
jgi:hypothetical protein